MKLLMLVAMVLAPLVVLPQLMLKVVEDSIVAYEYSGGDEFNSGALNETMWKKGIGGRRVLMVQDLAFNPRNVKIGEGLVTFIADKKDTTYTLTPWEVDSSYISKKRIQLTDSRFSTLYSVGAIVSREKYHYGLYELRFKVEEGRGVWPAFWFYGGTKNEEIDVFELKGERNDEIHVDVHCPSGCDHGYRKQPFSFGGSFGGWLPVSKFLHDGFNIMLLEWTDKELIWYLNGYPLAYYRGNFSKPMNVFLNTSVAKDGEGFAPGPDETTSWPNNYSVDYLRMWTPSPNSAPVLREGVSFTNSDKYTSDNSNRPKKKRGLMIRKKKLDPIEGLIMVSRKSQHKLLIRLSGKLAEGAEVSISGYKTSKVILSGSGETEVAFDPSDKELVVEVIQSDRTLKQVIKVQ